MTDDSTQVYINRYKILTIVFQAASSSLQKRKNSNWNWRAQSNWLGSHYCCLLCVCVGALSINYKFDRTQIIVRPMRTHDFMKWNSVETPLTNYMLNWAGKMWYLSNIKLFVFKINFGDFYEQKKRKITVSWVRVLSWFNFVHMVRDKRKINFLTCQMILD